MPPFRWCAARGGEVREPDEVRDSRIDPALGKERRKLPAVVGLVVEEVCGQDPKRGAALLGIDQGAIHKRGTQLLRREPSHKGIDLVVGSRTLVSQLVEVGVEPLGKGLDLKGLAEEASEPDPVSQKKVVQRPMDRAEESVSVLFALGIRETGAERVEFSVHPPVVARQQSTVFGGCQ